MLFDRVVSILFILLLSATSTFSQNWNNIYSKELEAEYFIVMGQFDKAAEKYIEALELIPQSANLKFKVGYSYIQTDDKKHLAIEFLLDASSSVSLEYDSRAVKETNAPVETYLFLGKAYQIAEKFDEAINSYRKYQEFIDETNEYWPYVEQQIRACTIAPTIIKTPVPFRISNIGETINDENSNFNAVFSNDGKTMAFTSVTRNGFEVFVSRKKDNEWTKPKNITDDLRGNNLITSSLSFDGTELYLIETFDIIRDVYVSDYIDNQWTKAVKLKKPINSKHSETHASISDDGKTLYFTSNRPGGNGGLDIYKTSLDAKGRWGEPVNLGPVVNTPLDEEIPFVTTCGKFLFFSSQGHNSIGGFDVFYIDLEKMGTPTNVGYPINNSDDNFFFPIDRYTGHMALFNDKSLGQKDIFRFKLMPWVEFSAEISYIGDKDSKPLEINVALLDIDDNELVFDSKSRIESAGFTRKLKPGKYQLTISAEGLESYLQEFIIPEDFTDPMFSVNAQIKNSPPIEPLLADNVSVTDTISMPEEPNLQEVAQNESEQKSNEPELIADEIIPDKPKAEPKKITPTLIEDNLNGDFFTVQIMALRNPVEIEFFTNVSNVSILKGTDDFYRYTAGIFETMEEAKVLQLDLKSKGYNDAFIRRIQARKGYTIQIMALAVPRDIKIFKNLDEINVTKGADELHRYSVGDFDSIEQAQDELQRIVSLGYKDAFIRKTIK